MTCRKYTAEFKNQVIKEALETGNNAIVARRHELNPNMVSRWVREYKQDKHHSLPVEHSIINEIYPDYKQLTKENEQPKKLLDEKDLEIAILRDLVKKKTLTC
ncbi:transposase [Carboxydocella sp. ULO1]|uniref:transposase n=1 Tax=Carboxydocella sp. ULO1 TaxID=1926599 RepID=UPI0009C98C21|nr:transposase [Carboxydocella sp. ULO1]GAW28870.1 transposase [Carboxydocella sp. ULO1]